MKKRKNLLLLIIIAVSITLIALVSYSIYLHYAKSFLL